MNKPPGQVTVTVETGYCPFCFRVRNLRREERHVGTLVRTTINCETCHRTLSSTMGVAGEEAAAGLPAQGDAGDGAETGQAAAREATSSAETAAKPAPPKTAAAKPVAKAAAKPRAKASATKTQAPKSRSPRGK
jgi:hypothetical protein